MTDRLILLLTGLLATYQIALGIDGLHTGPIVCYTIAFGVLLVAGLLLIILGFEILDSPYVVVTATLIPLSLSMGLIWQFLPANRLAYLVFVFLGFFLVVVTRLFSSGKLAILTLALVHGVAGLVIFILPIALAWQGTQAPGFALVGLGGALIGVGGLLLSFLKSGRPILSRKTILTVLPGLLFLMTLSFVAGFTFL